MLTVRSFYRQVSFFFFFFLEISYYLEFVRFFGTSGFSSRSCTNFNQISLWEIGRKVPVQQVYIEVPKKMKGLMYLVCLTSAFKRSKDLKWCFNVIMSEKYKKIVRAKNRLSTFFYSRSYQIVVTYNITKPYLQDILSPFKRQ